VADWLGKQHEASQGMRSVYDHRFHNHENKRTALEEDLERKYRELVGKIIDVENRMSLISRLWWPGEERLRGRREDDRRGQTYDFETAWKDIVKAAQTGRIATLSRNVVNSVTSIARARYRCAPSSPATRGP